MRKFYSFLLATVALLCSTAANAQSFTIDNLDYAILSSTDKTVALTGGSPSGELVIPSTVTYESVDYTVTEVAAGAFHYNNTMTSVTIPATIEYIRRAAFSDCSNVTAFNVAADNATYVSENGVIYTKDMSTIILCPNTTTGVYKIRANVSTIGECAFDGCTKIEKIIIPLSVSTIDRYAFANCELLTELTIPASVTSLHNTAFGEVEVDDCDNLKEITLLATTPPTWYGAMQYLPEDAKINVLAIALDDYAAAEGWSNFTNIVAIAKETIAEGEYFFRQNGPHGKETMYDNEGGAFSVSNVDCTVVGNEYVWTLSAGTNGGYYILNKNSNLYLTSDISTVSARSLALKATPEEFYFYKYTYDDGEKACYLIQSEAMAANNEALDAAGNNDEVIAWPIGTDNETSNWELVPNFGWSYNSETKTLTISADAAMMDYVNIESRPWHHVSSSIENIIIGEDVTTIGNNAFSGCTGLENITLLMPAENLTGIGDNAFSGVSSSCALNVPNGEASNYAAIDEFSSFTNVTELDFYGKCGDNAYWTLNEGVLTIFGEGAMYNYNHGETPWHSNKENITSVTIKEGVTSIGNCAFWNCSGLTSIEIPSNVTSIGKYAFDGCNNLTSIAVDEGNTIYDSRGNCNAIIETASNTLIRGCKNTVIPASVTSIGYNAFISCNGLTSIEIPSSVTSIEDGAFADCTDLTSIEIPSSVTSIGMDAFNGCTGLTSIEIPSSVTSIGGFAFIGCHGLTSIEIPSSVTSIGNLAFAYCTGLTSIVSHIAAEDLFAPGSYAFDEIDKDACTLCVPAGAKSTYAATDGWKDFTNIVEFNGKCGDNAYWALNEETGVLTIFGEGAIYNYNNDTDRAPWYSDRENISTVSIGSGITVIGKWALAGCLLTSIELPNTLRTIREEAFSDCSALTSITIPASVTYIERFVFACKSLETIVVEAGNTVYDSRNNCNAIIETATNKLIAGSANTVIPEGITTIGVYAFDNNIGIKNLEIPSSVTSIGICAFYGCTGLTSIEIHEGVTSIEAGAFNSCTGLTSIEIPASVTSISNSAFYECSGLTSVEIPSSVTSIGYNAFIGCTGLKSIEIPSSVTSIGYNAFKGCTGLTSIVSHIAAENLFAPGGDAFRVIDKNACTLYVPAGAKSTYAATEQWKDFTNIVEFNGKCGDNAYWALNEETGAFTIFGTGAMYNYNFDMPWYSNKENITSVTIEEGVTSIGQRAFRDCTGLTSIEIPSSVTNIYYEAFYGCHGLTSVEIPSSVTSIGISAFYGCIGLTSIVVDEGNSVYDSRGNCNAIIETASNTLISGCKNTIIPSSVTSIGEGAFGGCTGLTSIEIPSSVTSIGLYAFAGCYGLTSIEIPEGVTSIEFGIFYYCISLTSITSHIAAENLFAPVNDAFYGVDKDACTLYVPAGAKSTYESTDRWKEFTNIVETYDLTVTAAGYATLYLGTAVEIPAGVEAYTAGRIEGDLLKMQAVEDVIPANTAVIIKAEEGNYTFIPSNETPDAIEGNLLRGTLIDTYIKPAGAQTAYVLSKVDGVVGMYRAKLKADGTFKNNANRVYMLLGEINVGEGDLDTSNPGGQLSNGYRFDFSGTTAIESVENEQQGEAVYYDLSGRRVENPTKGIYIVNGRKVFIK